MKNSAFEVYSASRSAHQLEALPPTRLGGADAVLLQSNCANNLLKVPTQ